MGMCLKVLKDDMVVNDKTLTYLLIAVAFVIVFIYAY